MAGYIGSRVSNSLVSLDGVAISSTTKIQPFIGSVAPFAMATAPAGWLVCNGANYSQTTYADLFNAIGSTWVKAWTNGESITTGDYRKNASGVIYIATSTATTSGSDVGDDTGVTWSASTDFLVPDFRGEFLRGFDNGQGNDPDAASRTGGDAVGSAQSNGIPRLFGSFSDYHGNARHTVTNQTGHSGTLALYGSGTSSYRQALQTDGGSYAFVNLDSSRVIPHGSDVRPTNKYVQYCIKF